MFYTEKTEKKKLAFEVTQVKRYFDFDTGKKIECAVFKSEYGSFSLPLSSSADIKESDEMYVDCTFLYLKPELTVKDKVKLEIEKRKLAKKYYPNQVQKILSKYYIGSVYIRLDLGIFNDIAVSNNFSFGEDFFEEEIEEYKLTEASSLTKS